KFRPPDIAQLRGPQLRALSRRVIRMKVWPAYYQKKLRLSQRACGWRFVRYSSAHERATILTPAITGAVELRSHQCALQLADRGGSTRDRRCRAAGASLSRGGRGR